MLIPLLLAVFPGDCLAENLDDQLRLIRGGFEDGLFDLVAGEARDFLQKAGHHPARGEVFLILGYIEKSRRNPKNAVEYFMKATESDNAMIRLQGYYEAASQSWQSGDYKSAADRYRAIVDENQGGPIARLAAFWLIPSLFKCGEFNDVVRFATDLLDNDEGLDSESLIQVMYYRGKSLFNTDRYSEAVKDLQTVYLSDTPEFSEDAALTVARVYLDTQESRLADLWASRRIATSYSRAAHVIRAAYANECGDLSGVRKHFLAIVNDPDISETDRDAILQKIAICESRIAAAVKSAWWLPLLEYCENNPESLLVDDVLAEIIHQTELFPMPFGLVYFLETLREWDPVDHGPQLAQIFLSINEYDAAVRWITRHFVSSDDKDPDRSMRLVLARLVSAMGDQDLAAEELKRLDFFSKEETDGSGNLFQQAELMFQAGMYQRAASMYQEIAISNDGSAHEKKQAIFRLGDSYFQMNEWILSTEVFSRFIADYPDAPHSEREAALRRIALGLVYADRWDQSKDAIETYLKQFPETEYEGEMYYLKGLSEGNIGALDQALLSLGFALDHLTDSVYVESVKNAIRQITDRKTPEFDGASNVD